MIEWLRCGSNFRQFIVNDAEVELYAQDKEAQLLSVMCTAKPKYETKAKRQPGNSAQAILAELSITFPLSLRVRAGNGSIWRLNVMHNYHATNMDNSDRFNLRLNFMIIEHQAE
jgi:hypothetical protein